MRPAARLGLVLAIFALAGCGRGADVLTLEFLDELVEAPARQVKAAVVLDADCESLLSVPHTDLESVATVNARRSTSYPVDPDLGLFENAPRGQPLAVDVAASDADGLVVSRSCTTTTLALDTQTTVTVPMNGLPPCESAPTVLDLAIVLDTSTGMRNANIGLGGELYDHLEDFADREFGFPVQFSVVAQGHIDAGELLPATSDRQSVLQTMESLRNLAEGDAQHYAGLQVAAAHLKDRALCGHRPAVLWIGGGPDETDVITFDMATIEVVGTRGFPTDDIYVHGIGVSAEAIGSMQLLADRVDYAVVEGALTADRLAAALLNARFQFQGLMQ